MESRRSAGKLEFELFENHLATAVLVVKNVVVVTSFSEATPLLFVHFKSVHAPKRERGEALERRR